MLKFTSCPAWVLLIALTYSAASAQATPPAPSGAPQSSPQPASPDSQIVGDTPARPLTPAELTAKAWTMLSDSVADQRHADVRVQGLAALGLLGSNPRSLRLIESAMTDHDVDVRTAAVLAAGQTRAPSTTSAMRRMLDDSEPQVAYAAALTLWKMGDRSGEDILMAVVDGERRTSATLVSGTEHTVNKDLHSPSTLARIGALQGASMLLGPFGIGLTAYEYIRKNGGDSARVTAIEQLSQEKTEPLRKQFIAALNDKDLGVRAAAAKALSTYRQPDTSAAIATLFADSKVPVRLTAAAAYLISTGDSPASPDPNAHAAAPVRHRR